MNRNKSIRVAILCLSLAMAGSLPIDAQKVTFHEGSISLKQAFEKLESSSAYKIAYNDSQLDVSRKVSMDQKDMEVLQVLSQLLKNTGYTYKINGNYVIIADEAVAPTSELPSHLSVHNDLLSKNSPYKASVHTHPIELIAMTHCEKFLQKDVATNLLWSMIPETKAFCPRGLGIIPYKLPSSVELAEATIKELQDYDVVMWEKHGVFAVDCDAMQAFDQIDVLNKSALIYIAAKNMGFEPDGMSQEQMKEMSVAFNLPK